MLAAHWHASFSVFLAKTALQPVDCGMLSGASQCSRQGVSQCMSYWMDHMHMHMHMHMPRCHVRSRELFLKTTVSKLEAQNLSIPPVRYTPRVSTCSSH